MSLTESQRADLFAALESRGWSWNEGFIYAPHRSLWLLGSSPWTGDLPDFHERMQGRLQRIEWLSPEYDDPHYHRKVMDDTACLVDILAAMLSEKQTCPCYWTPKELVAAGNWAAIEALAREAAVLR